MCRESPRPLPHGFPRPGGLPAFIAGGPETSRCFSEWLVIQAVGKMG